MGGGNNFMSKKGFHPGSHANQSRIKEAEEKAAAKKKQDEERLAQYLKEQELFNQKSLISKESRDKLSLSFMYNPPPGTSQGGTKSSGAKQEPSGDTETMKWNRAGSSGVKQEPSESKKKDKKLRKGSSSYSSSDEEINLTWSRPEPKAKKKIKTEK